MTDNEPSLSRIIAGVMRWGNLTQGEISQLIDCHLDHGISTFDHADIYGGYTIEAAFGNALQQHPRRRQQMQIVTKCGIQFPCSARPDAKVKSYQCSREYIIQSAEQSLLNLKTDYLDLLLIHRPSPLMEAEEVADAFAHLKQSGKVLHFGVSNFTPSQVDYLRQYTPLVTNQVEASLTHTTPFFDGTFDQCLQLNIKPMVWSPLGRLFSCPEEQQSIRINKVLTELLSNYNLTSIDSLALAWLLHHPSQMAPIIGTTKQHRVSTALNALDVKLDHEDWFLLLEASRGHELA